MNHVVGLGEVESFTRAMALKIAALTPVVRRVHQRVAATVLEDLSLAGLTAEDQAFAVFSVRYDGSPGGLARVPQGA